MSQEGNSCLPWLPGRKLLTAIELLPSTISINIDTAMAWTAGQILITFFFPLRFYTLGANISF